MIASTTICLTVLLFLIGLERLHTSEVLKSPLKIRQSCECGRVRVSGGPTLTFREGRWVGSPLLDTTVRRTRLSFWPTTSICSSLKSIYMVYKISFEHGCTMNVRRYSEKQIFHKTTTTLKTGKGFHLIRR